MKNPAKLSDEQLQEILERKLGNVGEKVLVQEEQKGRLAERIEELEEELRNQGDVTSSAEEAIRDRDKRVAELEAENAELRKAALAVIAGWDMDRIKLRDMWILEDGLRVALAQPSTTQDGGGG